MFHRMIDDFKESMATTVRLTSLAAAMAVAMFVTVSFLCAAAFIYVLQRHGVIPACLTGAGIFFVVTLITAGLYAGRTKRAPAPPPEAAKSAVQSALADPMLVATALQVVRAIGIKRLIPILAVGGLALGMLAGRKGTDDSPEA